MNAFKVTYTDGTSYVTSANDTLDEMTAYLKAEPHVTENPETGEETRRYVAKVEQIQEWFFDFFGRKVGAIGITYHNFAKVEAPNREEAELRLYDTYEHISRLQLSSVHNVKA